MPLWDPRGENFASFVEALFDDWDAVVREEDSQWSPEALVGAPRVSNGLSGEPKVTRKASFDPACSASICQWQLFFLRTSVSEF
jgi:hypothetical protein